MISAVWIALAVAQAPPPANRQHIEIRFCPEGKVRPYPLDSLRGVQGLLLQNVAIINRGSTPVTLEKIAIQLRNSGKAVDERRFGREEIAAAAKSGAGAKAQGMFELAGFQFCDGRLLDRAGVAATSVLQPGQEANLARPFARQSTRPPRMPTSGLNCHSLSELRSRLMSAFHPSRTLRYRPLSTY